MREKKQKKEERKRRKAAAKAAGARAGGEQAEESSRVARPARKSLSDWRGKFAMSGLGLGSAGAASRGGSARGSAGDVSSLVGEKVVVQKREAYSDKFYRKVNYKDDLQTVPVPTSRTVNMLDMWKRHLDGVSHS